ncbi:lymphocyte function-associated antigen 3-like isoform 2-T2 [Vipera latastei]
MTVWKRLLWALLGAAAALCVAKGCSNHKFIVGVEGEDIVLSPSVKDNLTRIYWKKGENIVAKSRFSIPPRMENQRLSLDSSSGNLFLKNLSKEDAGNYTAEAFINEEMKVTCFDLKILVRPDINCTVNNDTIQLSCTSASQDLPLTYSWDYIRNEEITYVNDSVVQLHRNSKHLQKIICYVIASNSTASNSINLSDCIIEEPDHQSRCRIHLIAVLIIPVAMFSCWLIENYLKKRKERKNLNESQSEVKNVRGNYKEEASKLES